MKRIISEEVREKRRKRNNLVMGVGLIILMVFSTVGYALLSGDRTIGAVGSGTNYNGQYWVVNEGGNEFYFSSNPAELPVINVPSNINLGKYSGREVFLVSDSVDVIQEISINLGKYSGRMQEACLGSCEKNLPEKTCSENLIIFTTSESPRIYADNNCVFIEGDISTVDAFLIKALSLSTEN